MRARMLVIAFAAPLALGTAVGGCRALQPRSPGRAQRSPRALAPSASCRAVPSRAGSCGARAPRDRRRSDRQPAGAPAPRRRRGLRCGRSTSGRLWRLHLAASSSCAASPRIASRIDRRRRSPAGRCLAGREMGGLEPADGSGFSWKRLKGPGDRPVPAGSFARARQAPRQCGDRRRAPSRRALPAARRCAAKPAIARRGGGTRGAPALGRARVSGTRFRSSIAAIVPL